MINIDPRTSECWGHVVSSGDECHSGEKAEGYDKIKWQKTAVDILNLVSYSFVPKINDGVWAGKCGICDTAYINNFAHGTDLGAFCCYKVPVDLPDTQFRLTMPCNNVNNNNSLINKAPTHIVLWRCT